MPSSFSGVNGTRVVPRTPHHGLSSQAQRTSPLPQVLERKFVQSSCANALRVPLSAFPDAPHMRVLTALGAPDSETPSAPPHVQLYGNLLWDVLLEEIASQPSHGNLGP